MEHEKYTKMRRVARKAGTIEELKHIETYVGLLMFLFFAVLGILVMRQAISWTPSNSFGLYLPSSFSHMPVNNPNLLSSPHPLNQSLVNLWVANLSKNSTQLSSLVVNGTLSLISIGGIFGGLFIIGIGYILFLLLNALGYSNEFNEAIKEAKRTALYRAGFTTKDIGEYRKILMKMSEPI